MKRFVLASAIVLSVSFSGFAQSEVSSRGQGYVFFAPGVVSSPGATGFAHFGGGGEAVIKNVGIGAEVGYLTPWQYFSEGMGVFSANGSYHIPTGGKVSPFFTGGYSVFFRSGTANGLNFGGGVNYWFRERMALRFEVRDNVLDREAHFVGFRVGLSFR